MDDIELELQAKLTEQKLGISDYNSVETFQDEMRTEQGDLVLERVAKILGLTAKDVREEFLDEGLKSKSVIKRGKSEKFKALVGSTATVIAREMDDPLYKKLAKANKARLAFKMKLQQKYHAKAIKRAKDILKGRKIVSSRDIPNSMANASKHA